MCQGHGRRNQTYSLQLLMPTSPESQDSTLFSAVCLFSMVQSGEVAPMEDLLEGLLGGTCWGEQAHFPGLVPSSGKW
jgi:hypothetical protein